MTEKALTDDQTQALWDKMAGESEADGKSPSASDAGSEDDEDDDKGEPDESEADGNADAEDDPYEGLSPGLKARLVALEAEASTQKELNQRLKTAEGRVAAMQRELDVAKNAAKSVGNGPTDAQIAAAKASTQKWDTLKSEFPDWAEATTEFVNAKLAGLKPADTKGLTPQEVAAVVKMEVAKSRVSDKHENWLEDINTPEYKTWYDAQTTDIRKLGDSDQPKDAIRLLDLYAESKAKPADEVANQRKKKLEAAVGSKPGKAGASTSKTVDQMSDAELWDYEAKRAQKRGEKNGLTY